MKTKTLISIIALSTTTSVFAGYAAAHEFWIQPNSFLSSGGELVRLELMHGERFLGQPVPRNSPMIMRYELVSKSNEPVQVAGLHGTTQGYLRPEHAGVVVYQTHHYRNDLTADKFERYLEEERLGEITRQRELLGETDLPGREVYSRCAKSILMIEGRTKAASEIDHDTGLPLEIILQESGSEPQLSNVQAMIEFEDQPISGLRVVAVHASSPDTLIELESDSNGMISFESKPGEWLITTLHIRRSQSNTVADWESFWASSTFVILDG